MVSVSSLQQKPELRHVWHVCTCKSGVQVSLEDRKGVSYKSHVVRPLLEQYELLTAEPSLQPLYVFVVLFFKNRVLLLALTGLELAMQTRLALNSQRSASYCLLNAEIRGMCLALIRDF